MIVRPREMIATQSPSEITLRDAIEVARLAPSSHNCQPWAIASFESSDVSKRLTDWLREPRRAGERWMVIAIDKNRELTALGSLATEMRLSCGMFLQLLTAALGERGLATRIVACEGRPPIAGFPETWTPLAAVAIAPGVPRDAAWPTRHAVDRRTNRAPYQERSVDRVARDALASAAPLFAERDGVSIQLIEERGAIRALGRFVGRHAGVDFANLQGWTETFQYIRFGNEPAPDGFAVTQLFGPLPAAVRQFLRLALSPGVMRFARHLGVPRVMARELGKLVGASPLLACVSITDPAPWSEVAAGGAAMDLWMRATAAGLALHPVSAVLQHDAIREQFQRLVVARGRAVFFARVGFPTTTFPPTPRRSLEPGDGTGWVRL